MEVSQETVRKELRDYGLITRMRRPKHRQRRERMMREGILPWKDCRWTPQSMTGLWVI